MSKVTPTWKRPFVGVALAIAYAAIWIMGRETGFWERVLPPKLAGIMWVFGIILFMAVVPILFMSAIEKNEKNPDA